MTFWLLTAALCFLVVAGLWWSVRRRQTEPRTHAAAHNLAVYQDQLDELARDRDRGLIGGAEYAAAETEIKRRMLEASELSGAPDATAGDSSRAHGTSGRLGTGMVLMSGLAVVAGGVALYAALGRPDLATGPGATARGPTAEDMRRAQSMSPEERAAMIRGMVESLAARLKQNPDDFAGWMRLGRAWAVLREWRKSADAYRRAMALKPENVPALAAFVANRVRSVPRGSALPEDLKAAVAALARRSPDHPLALYLGGLIAAEAGERPVALRLWRRLLARLPEDSPLTPVLRRRIAALSSGGASPKGAPSGGAPRTPAPTSPSGE